MKKKLMERILEELLKDAKQSDRKIAEKLGCSQVSVTRYRQALERKGVIWGYTAITDPLKNRNVYFCFWKINPIKKEPLKDVKEMIAKKISKKYGVRLISYYSLLDSEYDYLMKFSAGSDYDFNEYLKEMRREFNDFFQGSPRIVKPVLVFEEEGKFNPQLLKEMAEVLGLKEIK